MDEEIITQLQMTRYRRSGLRWGYRNGHRYLSLSNRVRIVGQDKGATGQAEDHQPGLLKHYQRRQEKVNGMVRKQFKVYEPNAVLLSNITYVPTDDVAGCT